MRMALQRISAAAGSDRAEAVGLGYGETLRWFAPVVTEAQRQLILQYAQEVLAAGEFPPLGPQLQRMIRSFESQPAAPAITSGIVLLSHADTDLLALDSARRDLPPQFPPVAGFSLASVPTAAALSGLFAVPREGPLFAIVRVHGVAEAVPGLTELVARAQMQGWSVTVISGVELNSSGLLGTSTVPPDVAAQLTAYFMAGGARNVQHALRFAAGKCLGLQIDCDPPQVMPAHGLYHPDLLVTSTQEWSGRQTGKPVAWVVFYRAHVLSANLQFVDHSIRALEAHGFDAVGVFTSSLRDLGEDGTPAALRLLPPPDVIVNTVSFPLINLTSADGTAGAGCAAFQRLGAPWLQAICAGSSRQAWAESNAGLGPAEAAMNVALPECDGRVITVPISFKEHHRYVADMERLMRVAGIARRFATLRAKANADKRIAVVLNNSGGKAQKVGGAVGLDTPASLLRWLIDLRDTGYDVGALPASADELMATLLSRGCYDEKCPTNPVTAQRLPRTHYAQWFRSRSPQFQKSLRDVWGEPGDSGPTVAPPRWRAGKYSMRAPLLSLHEPDTDDYDYLFSATAFGNVVIAIQPPRGFGFDQETMYHDPDMPPCHHYAAFYRWIADVWRADAVVQWGTHGTLEWLPGKSLALSADCAPDELLGELPLFYPFVVNNPGEGAQAKRRAHAVIIGHLVPPLTLAEAHGPLATLARLVEEYYRAEVLDPPKLTVLRTQIWELVQAQHLDEDLRQIRRERHGDHEHTWDERISEQGVPRGLESLSGRSFAHLLEDLDAYLCDLGRAQIRDGLHVFGVAPAGAALIDLLFVILQSPNAGVPALGDALARACSIEPAQLRERKGLWPGSPGPVLGFAPDAVVTAGQVRSAIDTAGRMLLQAMAGLEFDPTRVEELVRSRFAPGCMDLQAVLRFACEVLAPNLAHTSDETRNLLLALDGGYVPAGPAGAPSRGMAHVLPTGRNFYTVDPRSLPTPAAWATGVQLADEVLRHHRASTGRWPESIAMSVWGTPTMRTGGDEIAEALALLGVRPRWDAATRRLLGVEVMPLEELGRPRIDVVLRASGFFRDAFPGLMKLFDAAVQQVVRLDESQEHNHVRKHWLQQTAQLLARGLDEELAARGAAYRVFSSRPGTYGTGILDLVEHGSWDNPAELADAAVSWGGWAYGEQAPTQAADLFAMQLERVDLTLHNQDNHEQDLFDASDYFEYQGGLIAAVAKASGAQPGALVGDSSDPTRPEVRTLQAQALRVIRARVLNPKWLAGIRRHGYRGGMEMATTVDALFGFAATAGIVTDWMFESVAQALALGEAQDFLQRSNPWALHAIVERLLEAQQRQLWSADPRTLESLRAVLLTSEAAMEDQT